MGGAHLDGHVRDQLAQPHALVLLTQSGVNAVGREGWPWEGAHLDGHVRDEFHQPHALALVHARYQTEVKDADPACTMQVHGGVSSSVVAVHVRRPFVGKSILRARNLAQS